MANFGRFDAGKDSGPPSVGDETTRYRKSPLGYLEDDSLAKDNPAKAETYGTVPPVSKYKKSFWDNPKTQTHERIHQGQFAAELPRSDNFAWQVRAALAGYPTQNSSDPTHDFSELPAYAFSYARERPTVSSFRNRGNSIEVSNSLAIDRKNLADSQQRAFNNYMDLAQKIAPRRRHNVMAPMPEELQRGYINSGPGVEGFPLPEEQESVLSMIKRSLRGK